MKGALAKATTKVDIEIGSRIKAMRLLRGMSQSDLGNALPIPLTFQQIQKYEKGTNRVSTSALIEICKILKCHPNDIIGSYFDGNESSTADLMLRVRKYEDTIRSIRSTLNNVG